MWIGNFCQNNSLNAPELITKNKKLGRVDVQDVKEIYSAQIGSEDGKEKHMVVDYDEISWFYAHTRGIKTDENLYLEIRDSVFGKDPLLLIGKNVKVDESGVIKVKINWALIKNKVSFLTVYAIVKENNADGKVLYDADGSFSMATAKLMKSSSLVKEVGYKSAVMVEGSSIKKGKQEEKCPRCEAEITIKDIEDCFGVLSSAKNYRTEVVEYLNQFIKQRKNTSNPIHLDTCLRKAHFFAQVGVETLGINPDWIVEGNINHSSKSAKSAFGDRARNLENKGLLNDYCADRSQERLYNYLYANENGFGNGNGNELSGDGYLFRGRGLKQLTGRNNYKVASETLKEIFPDDYINLENNPKKVEEIKYAVLTALAFWENHKIWNQADLIKSSGDSDEMFKTIRRKVVGSSAFKWKEAKNYFLKTYTAFNVLECKKDSMQNGNENLYKIDYVKETYIQEMQSDSKIYKYEIYKNGIFEKSFSAVKNEHNLLKFPENGINWNRYGTRDSGKTAGDNWISEKTFAALLGFFYNLNYKYSGIGTLYYNDISADDGITNLGHSTHKKGTDVDIRYPGCTNASGEQLWTVAKKYWGSESKLDEVMQNIYSIAVKWDFEKNYQYKTVKNASYSNGHDNHFHIGHK